MNEVSVKYNISSEEFVRNIQDTFRRVNEITRTNNEEQIRLSQEVYASMNNILDNYVSRVKMTFDLMAEIVRNTWNITSADSEHYFNNINKKIDEMIDKMKELADKEVQINRDAIKQRLEDNRSETNEIAKETAKRIEEKKKEIDMAAQLYNVMGTIRGGISGSGVFQGSQLNQIIGIGSDAIGGTVDIITGINAGRGIQNLFRSITSGIGLIMQNIEKADNLQRQTMLGFGAGGIDVSSIYGDELSMLPSQNISFINRLKETQKKFAMTPEFQTDQQLSLFQQSRGSRVFGDDTNYHSLGVDATLIGRARNMPSSEVMNFFIEMRQKLNEPLENLTGRFFQLDNISKELGLNLRQVIGDYQNMMRENQKYGFSQEQLMGIYQEFGDEVKKGTVTASELFSYMRGIAGLGTDQTTGIVALLLQNPEGLLENYQGNRGNAQELLSLIGSAQSRDGDITAAQLLRIINAGPEADLSQNPFLSDIANKYGLSSDLIRRLNPETERLMWNLGIQMGQGTDPGTGRLIQEQIMQTMGLGLPTNLYDSGMMERGIRTAGTTRGITGLDDAIIQGRGVMQNTSDRLEELAPWLKKIIMEVDDLGERLTKNAEHVWKQTNDVSEVLKTVSEDLMIGGAKFAKMFGYDMPDLYGDFSMSVEKFDKAVDKISGYSETSVGMAKGFFGNSMNILGDAVKLAQDIGMLAGGYFIYEIATKGWEDNAPYRISNRFKTIYNETLNLFK